MKKIFTLISMALLSLGVSAQTEGMIELSWDTMVKNETGDNAADQTNTTFTGADGFVLTREDGSARTQARTERESCAKVLNAQNDRVQKLVIPAGTKVYKINFYGWSQGDNWTYIYAYGPSSAEWEWTDPIGTAIKDNKTIIEQAKYPLDPCVVKEENAKDGYSPVYHNAGYCFASIDFSDEPYEGQFCFVFSGNNQERFWMEIYTTAEAAAKAPTAEAVTIGKENSQTIYIDAAAQAEAELAANTIELSWDTMVKNEAGDNAADQTTTEFWADETAGTKTGFILTREDGSARTQAMTTREECSKVLNAQNDRVQKLVIPAGTKVYKINFYGWSQGDNWTYIYAYGPSSAEWEWTDPIGTGIKDNKTIIEQAKYPLDPCVVKEENAKDGYSPVYHNAGYCFAQFDFTADIDGDGIADPYEGELCFVFSGNNQERFWMVVYTSPEAAAKAPNPEGVTIGKENSQTVFLDAAAERERLRYDIIGEEDNSTAWWTAFSDYYTIPADNTLHLEFTNYSDKATNWDNWLAVLANKERGTEGYEEYFVVRADNYGWGKNYGETAADGTISLATTTRECNWDWDNFTTIMDGAYVKLDIIRDGSKVNVNADVFGADGNSYYQKYSMDIQEAEADVIAFLTVEKGHLKLDKEATRISATTGIESVAAQPQPSKAGRYNLAGQKVDAQYKGIVIENGKKFVIK